MAGWYWCRNPIFWAVVSRPSRSLILVGRGRCGLRNGRLVSEGFPVADISDHLADGSVIWLDLRDPDREDLAVLRNRFHGEDGLERAEQLYSGLCAENLEDEHLWTALFRIYERLGSSVGLEWAVRRYRDAQVELGTTENTDIARMPLPPNLERLVKDFRSRIGSASSPAGS